jgi:uncharacterized phage infection (PIP) family protein YhgE
MSNTSPQGGFSKQTNDLSGQAKAFASDVKDKAGEMSADATQLAKEQVTKLGEAAEQLASGAAEHVKDTVHQQRSAGADFIGSIAAATERAAGEFDTAMPQAAQYIRQASEQIQSVAEVVRERDMRELVGEVENFARRQPTLFFGGAMILGFATLRFLKSSSPRHGTSNDTASNAFEQHRAS